MRIWVVDTVCWMRMVRNLTKIGFYEIDGGPSGKWWEGSVKGTHTHIGSWDNTIDMLATAKMLKVIGHEIRFYTQAEYELNLFLEDA